MSEKITWLSYEFNIHDTNVSWKSVGGIYIFCAINQANQWVPLYIGQAFSLAVAPRRVARGEGASLTTAGPPALRGLVLSQRDKTHRLAPATFNRTHSSCGHFLWRAAGGRARLAPCELTDDSPVSQCRRSRHRFTGEAA